MKSQRRLGNESARNRAILIEAAEQLLCEEGYGAITARKVANKAGLKMPLVYYYFETMDDLIKEVIRKNAARRLKRFVRALASASPLQALWKLNRDHSSAISATELIALANHREAIRTEAVAAAKQFRTLQIEAVDRLFAEKGVDRDVCPPAAIVAMVTALTRAMAQDTALGVTEGYAEAIDLIERGLALLAGNPAPSKTDDQD
ncbi:MAG: TetR/AcrR family transcriptional regulator [Bacteroidales bacterium]|nr:TetR/AcrR family transcriptional regulator [Bacteroidales bacterium]